MPRGSFITSRISPRFEREQTKERDLKQSEKLEKNAMER